MFPYLSRTEDPPPKRTAARSNRAGNAMSGDRAMRRNRKGLTQGEPFFFCSRLLVALCSCPVATTKYVAFHFVPLTRRFVWDESRRERQRRIATFSVTRHQFGGLLVNWVLPSIQNYFVRGSVLHSGFC